jgi:mRNA-degrading endonuclease toxin of MazEF toxin-antitoxin module
VTTLGVDTSVAIPLLVQTHRAHAAVVRWWDGRGAGKRRAHRGNDRTAKDSVANVSQIVAIDRELLTERVGRVSAPDLGLIMAGIDLVLGRD